MKFATRSDSLAFLTPAGRQGFVIHHDPNDTYVIHLHGTKRWRIWPTREVSRPDGRPYRMGEEYRPEHLGDPLWDVSLRPGDVMYLPQGTPHVAVAENDVSLHLTVTVTPRHWPDLVRSLTTHLLPLDDERRGFPHLTEATVPEHAPALREHIEALVTRLRAVDTHEELLRLVAEGRTAEGTSRGHQFTAMAEVDAIAEDTLVRRTPVDFSFSPNPDGRTNVRVNGDTIAMQPAIADALRSETARTSLPAGKFAAPATSEESVRTVRSLVRLGILTAS
ncbi:JmjC domain-containing protein [Streptomyces solincola]|uniref:JmjC domain-containing protein n=1 Tax=Streptomyces solincola TaxID=2100817 RepID=UPI0015E27DFB|nr:cupin domain-containing protein [Streptomyces solincola]